MPLRKYIFYGTMLIAMILIGVYLNQDSPTPKVKHLLTDPFLQLPDKDSMHVVWFTGFKGAEHFATFGQELNQIAEATTTRLSRVRRENANGPQHRSIWRHETILKGLPQGVRTPYFVTSVTAKGENIKSDIFSLQPLPQAGQPLKILLTSDHQQNLMTPANFQKVVETVGMVDAVFFAGDLTNIPDNANEWFDDPKGLGFFATLQGRTQHFASNHPYSGGRILQYAPIFPCIGNHEVMGRFDGRTADFTKGRPRWYAAMRYDALEKKGPRGNRS